MFHERVAAGYRALAAAEPGRWRIVDAGRAVDDVVEASWGVVRSVING